MSDTVLTPMPKRAEVQRFEVFTGAGRRRRWSAEAKAQIVAESQRGGETVTGVARRHGLTVQQLFGGRRQARQGVAALPGLPGETMGFVPVEVTGKTPAPAVAAAMIEVALADAVIRVPCGADAATLAVVIGVLRGRG